MIGSLRGELLDRWGDGDLLIEVGGIGYRVTVTPTTLVEVGEPGDVVFVHVHHHQRDDAQVLYGFRTRSERECFESLLAAHGVGPALALAILSVHGPDALARVVADDDIDALCLVPGVGKKTAARLLIELKSSLSQPVLDAVGGPAHDITLGAPSARADVREALANLGYGPDEVASVVRELPDADDVSLLLKEALQRLAVG
jgi:Holliday junction DNA helicase RuvA